MSSAMAAWPPVRAHRAESWSSTTTTPLPRCSRRCSSRRDFDVRRAANGREGLTLAEEFAPNLILLDLAMPKVSGEDFATRYRQLPAATAQIVVVSGLSDAFVRAQATEARAVLKKPFEMSALLSVVHHLA